jgi:hypothetical protein
VRGKEESRSGFEKRDVKGMEDFEKRKLRGGGGDKKEKG